MTLIIGTDHSEQQLGIEWRLSIMLNSNSLTIVQTTVSKREKEK